MYCLRFAYYRRMKRWWMLCLLSVTLLIATVTYQRSQSSWTKSFILPEVMSSAPTINMASSGMSPAEKLLSSKMSFTKMSKVSKPIEKHYTYNPDMFERKNTADGHHRHNHASYYSTILHPNNTCSVSTFLFIAVVSKPSNQLHRKVYRETVLSPVTNNCLPDVKYVFVLGRTDNQELQGRLEEESAKYGDILQGNFTDSYENLTLKSLYLIQWANLNCPHTKYLMKLDDDVFTILDDVTYYLKFDSFANYSIAGSVFEKVVPIRDKSNKWHVDVADYPHQYYPTYVSGTAYVISYSLLHPLFTSALNVNFLRLEDMFITGVAAQATKLPVQYYQIPGFKFARSTGLNVAKVDFHTSKSIHGVDDQQLRFLYKRLKEEKPDDCL